MISPTNYKCHLGPAAGLLQLREGAGLQELQVGGDLLTDVVVQLTDFLQMFLGARVLWPRLIISHDGCGAPGGPSSVCHQISSQLFSAHLDPTWPGQRPAAAF